MHKQFKYHLTLVLKNPFLQTFNLKLYHHILQLCQLFQL